jgi:hypothetical protein
MSGGRMNWRRMEQQPRMRRQGVEDIQGGTPLSIRIPQQRPHIIATPRRAHDFRRDEFGFYIEPAWCSVRLFAVESFGAPRALVLDPSCGWGQIPHAAKAAGYSPVGADLIDRRSDPQASTDFRSRSATF